MARKYKTFGDGVCKYCDSIFLKRQPSSKYCGVVCQSRSYNRRRKGMKGHKTDTVDCKMCGVAFLYGHGSGVKYCSKKCMGLFGSKVGNRKRRAAKTATVSASYSRSDLIERDGLNCCHCGIKTIVVGDSDDDRYINEDHIIPLSKGGHDAIYNIQVLCRSCNIKKGNKIYPKDKGRAIDLWPEDPEKFINEFKKKTTTRRAGKSGVLGVGFDKDKNKWRARIERDGNRIYLGYFEDIERAKYCRLEAEKLLNKGVSMDNLREIVRLRIGY